MKPRILQRLPVQLLLPLLLGVALRATAASIVWTNTAGGVWKTAANWSPNKVPGGNDTAIVTNDGDYIITVNANASVGDLTLGGGTATPKLAITAGGLKISTNRVFTVESGAVLELAGGKLDGDGQLEIVGTMNWIKGEVRPFVHVATNGQLILSANNFKWLSTGIIDNEGTAMWSGSGAFQCDGGTALTNRGLFVLLNDVGITCTNPAPRPVFVNQGTLRKTNATDVSSFDNVQFKNRGNLDLQSGTISFGSKAHTFDDGSIISGPGIMQVAGATVTFSGNITAATPIQVTAGKLNGNYTLNGDLFVNGGQTEGNPTLNGNLTLVAGKDVSTATISGNLNVSGGQADGRTSVAGDLNLSAGSVTGDITVNGNLIWSGGTISGNNLVVQGDTTWSGGTLSGKLVVTPGNQLLIPAGANSLLSGGTITNYGTIVVSAKESLKTTGNAFLYNYGLLLVAEGEPISGDGSANTKVYNFGTLRKTGATTTKCKNVAFISGGIIDVQDGTFTFEGTKVHTLGAGTQLPGAGRFMLDGATLNLAPDIPSSGAFELASGTLVASGAFNGNLTWSGGALSGTLTLPATRQLNLTGSATKTMNKDSVLNNAGQAVMDSNSKLKFFANATINNSGTFEIQAVNCFSFNNGDLAAFNNTGILRKTVSTLPLEFSALQLVNRGTLDLQTGDLGFTASTHSLADGSVILGPGSIHVNGGTLNLTGAASFGSALYLDAGILSGNSTVAAALFVSGGLIPGNLTVNGPVTLTAGEVSGALMAMQTMDWSGGTISGTLVIPASAGLTVRPGGTRSLTGVLSNAGTVTVLASAPITLNNGTPLINTGLLEVQDEQPFKPTGNNKATFNNSGTFRKTTSPKTLPLSWVLLQNSGTLDVQAGVLEFTLNSHAFANGTRLSGPGTVRINGATVTMDTLLNAESAFELASGYLAGNATINGDLGQSGGQIPGAVSVSGAFAWSGGEIKGTLTGGELVTWSGGTLSGALTIPATCRLQVQDGDTKLMTGTLNNYGTLSLLALSQVQLDSGATINNAGLVETYAASPFSHLNGGTPTFNNTGTFRALGPTAATIGGEVNFVNSGVLDVAEGTLSFTGGNPTFNASTFITGAGLLRIAGATVAWNGPITNTSPVELAAGVLNAAGSLNGMLRWSGGTLSGQLTIAAGSEVRLPGTATKTLASVTVTNFGAIILEGSGALAFSGDAIIENNNLFELQAANSFTVPNSGKKWLNNRGSGRLRKTNSTQTFIFSNVLLQNSGTLDVQAGIVSFTANSHSFGDGSRTMGAGLLRVTGGTLNVSGTISLDAGFELAGGTLAGSASLNVNAPFTWPSGTMAGDLNIFGNSTWSGGELSGTLVVNGTLNWVGGLVSGTLSVPTASRVNILTGGNNSISGVLQNAGFVVVSNNASIKLLGGTPIVNSGVLEVQNEQPFTPNGTTKVNFLNSGTFRKTTSTKLMKLDYVLLQNSGVLDLQAGDLSLVLNGHNFTDGTRTTGPGAVRVSGATLAVAGNFTLGSPLVLDNGTVAGSATFNGPFQFNGGQVSDTLTVNGQFSWTGGLLKGGIVSQGAASWTGGEIDGWWCIATNTLLAIGGTGSKIIKGGTLTNCGSAVVTSPVAIQADGGAVIQNFGGFNLPASVTITTPWGGKPTFNNYGLLSLTNGFGVFKFPGKLQQFPSGQLELELAGRDAGTNFSQITGVPNLALDGVLVVRTSSGFEPALGDRLEILKCDQLTGGFATYSANTPRLSPDYSTTNVTLFAAAPAFTNQPASQTISDGASVTFTVGAYGSQPMTYQWFWNGAPVAGATNTALTFNNVHVDREGDYTALASNFWGSVMSTQANLKVILAPVITRQPESLTVLQGKDAVILVEASGTHLSYRWKFGDNWLAGATNATLWLTNVTAANAGKYKVEVSNPGGTVVSAEVILTVIVPPTITEQPASKNLNLGSSVTLSVKASGTTPFSFQWLKNGIAIPDANQSSFSIARMSRAEEGSYVVIVANAAGYDSSAPAVLLVNTPPTITAQPVGQTVNRGSDVVFNVAATGVPAPTYQWQLNGVNLPGANLPSLVLTNVQPSQSGNYHVTVENQFGAVESVPARLEVITPLLAFTDAFTNRGIIYTTNGVGHGSNCGATKEPGEPSHVGKGSATSSVWLSWWAPANGIATFTTLGSDFDTVLAVYRGTNVNALTKIAADDDAAGFHCSTVSFNVQAGTYYQIAVAGVGGACGNIVLGWDLQITSELLPQITQAPQDYTGNTNENLAVQVVFDAFEPTAIQWFFQGQLLAGATNSVLSITNLQDDKVGGYAVRLTALSGRTVVSPPGDIQINTQGRRTVAARNKFSEGIDSLLTGGGTGMGGAGTLRKLDFQTPKRGFSGTQIFSTLGADKDPGEPDHCGEPGGASSWFFLQAPADGLIRLDTVGSSFDTVLAVYTSPSLDFGSLVSVACDNDSGGDGRSSKVLIQASALTVYLIAVDGVNGANGTVKLNYTFGYPPVVTEPPASQIVPAGGNATFGVGVESDPGPVAYQWQFHGVDLPFATNAVLVVSNVQPSLTGDYCVRAWNALGTNTSATAQLRLAGPLQVSIARPGGAGSGFQLQMLGNANTRYVLECSPDLKHWTPLATNLTTTGRWDFVDTTATNAAYRFYRVAQSP